MNTIAKINFSSRATKVQVVMKGMCLVGALVTAGFSQNVNNPPGHILDANRRIGSGGLNAPVRQGPLVPNSNLYITGNVTGGARFQGLVPYQSVDEFNSALGSSTLDNFTRDSVGLSDLSSNQVIVPRAYLDPSRAVTHTFEGRVQTATERYQFAPATEPEYLPQQRVLSRGAVSTAIRPFSLSGFSLGSPGVLTTGQEGLPEPLPRPGLWRQERDSFERKTAETPEKLTRKESQPLESSEGSAPGEMPERELPEFQILPGSPTPFESSLQEAQMQPGMAGEQQSSGWPGRTAARTGDRGLASDEAAESAESPLPAPLPFSSRFSITPERFEQYMNQGRQFMREGRYYRAADVFGLASHYKENPGAGLLAKSQALLAAGEFMSAAYFLDKAIVQSFMSSDLPVDLVAMVGDEPKLQQRLADLTRWRNDSGQPMLLFLEAYVQYQLGQLEAAQASMDLLLKAMPANVTVQRLREMVVKAREVQKEQ